MSKCDVCNNKISILNKYKVLDGSVCLNCIRISNSFQTNTIEELNNTLEVLAKVLKEVLDEEK